MLQSLLLGLCAATVIYLVLKRWENVIYVFLLDLGASRDWPELDPAAYADVPDCSFLRQHATSITS